MRAGAPARCGGGFESRFAALRPVPSKPDLMGLLFGRTRSLRRRTQRREVLRRKVMERGGWAETPRQRAVSGR